MKMKQQDLLDSVNKLKKDVESGKVTDLICVGQSEDQVIQKICCDPIVGLGLAKYAEMKMKETIHDMQNTNQVGNFLSKVLGNSDPDDD